MPGAPATRGQSRPWLAGRWADFLTFRPNTDRFDNVHRGISVYRDAAVIGENPLVSHGSARKQQPS